MVRLIDIVRSPQRSFAHFRDEARWARHFAATMEHRGMPALPAATSLATDRLYARLDAADVRAIGARLDPGDAQRWVSTTEQDRRRLALAFGLHYGVPGVPEKTGLSPRMPSGEVHAMARGSIAAGGSYYYADIVTDALIGAGAELSGRMLDFGCSSGRVVRVLAAAFPDVDWRGCDPQPAPIAWARQHLPGVEFAVSREEPPAPYDDEAFDAVFAISIWSHYGERAARAWLAEMQRILRPGGHLLLTFHGWTSIAYYVAHAGRTRRRSIKLAADLYRDGFWFAPQFEEDGDHGIHNDEWGTAFLTAEWLLNEAVPEWSVVGYAPGRAEGNQDLIVLRRS